MAPGKVAKEKEEKANEEERATKRGGNRREKEKEGRKANREKEKDGTMAKEGVITGHSIISTVVTRRGARRTTHGTAGTGSSGA